MFEIINETCIRVRLNSTITHLYRDNITNIEMSYTEHTDSGLPTPCVKVYERRKFLWLIPYNKNTLTIVPVRWYETESSMETLKTAYVELYNWWKGWNANQNN
jgi:hypothetical protein